MYDHLKDLWKYNNGECCESCESSNAFSVWAKSGPGGIVYGNCNECQMNVDWLNWESFMKEMTPIKKVEK